MDRRNGAGSLRGDVLFRLTGASRNGSAPGPVRLRPALFARFGDLARLRYDFPAVLVSGGQGAAVRSVSSLVDDAIRATVPRGMTGGLTRSATLRIEREIRRLVAEGATGTLSSLWERAEQRLAISAASVHAAMAVDGEVVGCDGRGVDLMIEHVWRAVAARRAEALRRAIDDMVVRLEGIIEADLARSAEGRDAARLSSSVGAPQRGLFDFDEMARLLAAPSRGSALPAERRERVTRVIAGLRSRRVLAMDLAPYVCESLDEAVAAYRLRLPAMGELIAALATGDLEIRGAYVPEQHDAFFEGFRERALTPDDLARFPDILVRVRPGSRAQEADAVAACAMGAPLKVAVETDDAFAVGSRSGAAAVGLGDVFVVQAAASDLPRVAARLESAMSYQGSSLLSIFVPDRASALPTYLVAAAATESRAFPTFTYDPSAGADGSSRLVLDGAPQIERTWPEHDLSYADEHVQRVTERVPFTLADFALCDERTARDLSPIDGDAPAGDLVPLGAWLADGAAPSPTAIPYVNAIDPSDRLVRLVVDDHLVRETRRSGEAWKRLVALAASSLSSPVSSPSDVTSGRSHLAATLAPAGASGDAGQRTTAPTTARAAARSLSPSTSLGSAPADSALSASGAAGSGAEASSPDEAPAARAELTSPAGALTADDPYIETVRCATCNECTNLNPRMFKYNENKQAYIADPGAGTYRDLVEAAEACQVAVIHPGTPRDPNEPGLDELVERAAAFA